jgi:hypothetical protein
LEPWRQAVTKLDEHRTREITRVLNFYENDFTKYLATTIAYTETLPEEINNQIRDAFTHLTRAQQASTQAKITSEIDLSISHINRANRDCLKASIITARVELDDLVTDAVFYHGFLTPNLRTALSNLIDKRRKAYQSETLGDDDQVIKLEEILRLTMDLSDKIREHYSVAGLPKTKFLRAVMRWFRPISFVVTLLVGTFLGALFRPLLVNFFSSFLGS